MVNYIDNISKLVGNTPLIKLKQVSEDTWKWDAAAKNQEDWAWE